MGSKLPLTEDVALADVKVVFLALGVDPLGLKVVALDGKAALAAGFVGRLASSPVLKATKVGAILPDPGLAKEPAAANPEDALALDAQREDKIHLFA